LLVFQIQHSTETNKVNAVCSVTRDACCVSARLWVNTWYHWKYVL